MPTWQGGRKEREKEEELVAFFLTEENQFQLEIYSHINR